MDCGLEIFDGDLVTPRNFELKCVILSIEFVPLNGFYFYLYYFIIIFSRFFLFSFNFELKIKMQNGVVLVTLMEATT